MTPRHSAKVQAMLAQVQASMEEAMRQRRFGPTTVQALPIATFRENGGEEEHAPVLDATISNPSLMTLPVLMWITVVGRWGNRRICGADVMTVDGVAAAEWAWRITPAPRGP